MNYFWLNEIDVAKITENYGSPVYVYSESVFNEKINEVLSFSAPYSLIVRYAMKANSTSWILKHFDTMGIEFDASSGYEVDRALLIGIDPKKIMLTAQELPGNFVELINMGVKFNATSLHQLKSYAAKFPGTQLGIRLNPGIGSGHNKRTNVGGNDSSFGIWHEYLEDILTLAKQYKLEIHRIHIHIGSGSDPKYWQEIIDRALSFLQKVPSVSILNIGGGFKVSRSSDEKSTDLKSLGKKSSLSLKKFYEKTGRKIAFEIEPGNWLSAYAGILLTTIADIVDTGDKGNTFFRLDSGMTEITRPALYGVHHPMKLIPVNRKINTNELNYDAVVVGHCCESSDILTPEIGNPENFVSFSFPKAQIGDVLLFGAAGAYCSSMSLANYNSFPRVAEILKDNAGNFRLIRKRQTMQQIIENDSLE
ncbi:MAG: diaminopimelate decarboxylase [Candidatus Marinimicrobia bacterium]|nr:diaminopimelate decarboxylase [Candidatus Neomarinimicrobiota bacterium]